MKIEFCKNGVPPFDNTDYFICDVCGVDDWEMCYLRHGPSNSRKGILFLCPQCLATLHSITEPLSLLVQFGVDTKG
jgi:hypothetical protein